MRCVVLVPGTMGSVLSLPDGEEVWPPTPLEVTFGYKRKQKLLRDDIVVGDIVREVSCFDVYKPLIDTFAAVGFKEGGSGDRLHVFSYDWRRDLELLADQFAGRLDTLPDSVTSIAIVAHSMGGLICRLVLETGKFENKPWFGKINTFMTLATPHLGAPLALARILGLDSALGISAEDFREITADQRYPSGYQLLPAPGEAACWDINAESTLAELNIYNPAVATRLGLDPSLIARAAWLHETLARGKAPAAIRYFYFAATGHKTATRLNVSSISKLVTRSEDAGDGTVPMWSALPVSGQKQLVVGEHTSFFTDTTFKAVFFRLFGKHFPTPPTGVAGAETAELSVQSLSIRKDEEIELVIAPSAPVTKVESKIILESTEAPDNPFMPFGAGFDVRYSGPSIPFLKLRLPAVGKPGFYRIRLVGRPFETKPVQFAVTGK
ncbi:UNVERIFIED_ORG: pimeloyl-ACP methyl ester carboxylesterase [Rhizobium esperanzae]